MAVLEVYPQRTDVKKAASGRLLVPPAGTVGPAQQDTSAMISRFPGLTPTRSRAVATDDLVFAVAVAPDPVPPSVYQQAVKVLARIDESLALCGTDKSSILTATIYLADVTQKAEFNRAWDEMGRPGPSADARLHRRRDRAAACGRGRDHRRERPALTPRSIAAKRCVSKHGREHRPCGHPSRRVAARRSSG